MFGDITGFIADKLKPYLSQVFRNFDANNFGFSVGFFSGATLTLTDLQFRPNLLQDLGLDLPFQLDLLGGVGKIYVELGVSGLTVTISDVCLLASSLRRLTYDEKHELSAAVERKRAELVELLKKEAEAVLGAVEAVAVDEEPGFVMRTVMSYVQGATLILENVHLRFENHDGDGDGGHGGEVYAAGVTLKKLGVENVDEIADWSHGEATSASTFYKKGDLDRLAVYWNFGSAATGELYGTDYNSSASETAVEESIKGIVVKLRDFIGNEEKAKNINYVLNPVLAAARAMITRHPEKLEKPFSLPKVHADFTMEAIELGFTDLEYDAVLSLLDNVDQLERGRKWLKYRPTTPIVPGQKGSAKGWWKLAYAGAVSEASRRRQNWSWDHIKAHRALRDKYEEAYLRKLTADGSDTPSTPELVKEVQDLEDQLDNFNVLLARRETEGKNKVRMDLLEKKKEEEKAKSGGGGWGSWFGGGSSSTADVTVTKEELDKAMAELPEADRKKFVALIDYDPSASDAGQPAEPVSYPKDYDEFVVGANLKGVQGKLVKYKDEATGPLEILHFALVGFELALETHPAVSGLKATASMKTMSITGAKAGDAASGTDIFKSISDNTDSSTAAAAAAINFIDLTFELHPTDSPTADQKITYESQHSQLTYDAHTFQKLLEFVTPPPTKIQRVGGKSMFAGFTQVSGSKLASLGKSSATLELDIKIVAPVIVIPENGFLDVVKGGDALIGNLGTLTIKSKPRDKSETALAKVTDELSPETLAVMFNNFQIQLANFEVLLAWKGDDVTRIITCDPSYASKRPTPIAEAALINVDIWQCIVDEDVRFPKLKVGVAIPAINLDVVDQRFLRLLHLGLTLPLPKPKQAVGATPPTLVVDVDEDPSSTYADALQVAVKTAKSDTTTTDPEKAPQYTDLVVHVKLYEIKLNIAVQDPQTNKRTPLLAYNLNTFAIGLKLKTFGMSLDANIAWMNAEYVDATVPGITGPIYLLNTPTTVGGGTNTKDASFISAHVFSVTSACPKQLAGSVKQRVEVAIQSVDLILHQDAIQSILGILFGLKNELESITSKEAADVLVEEQVVKLETDSSASTSSELGRFRKLAMKFLDNPDDILLKATASLSRCSVKLTSSKAQITQLNVVDWRLDFEDKALVSKLSSDLTNLEILNLEAKTQFPKILTVDGSSKLISGQVVIHKPDTKAKTPEGKAALVAASSLEPQYEIRLAVGGPKLIILGSYLENVKNFATNFQNALAAAATYSKEVASAAGQAAVALGKDLYQTDLKLAINFNLQSPELVLARSDGSLEVFYYYFGNVAVKNSLRQEQQQAAAGNAGTAAAAAVAVFDDIHLDITGAKLVRAILDPGTKKPIVELALLEPLEAHVTVTRNLSFSWYKSAPKMKVQGTIVNVVVAISDDDVIYFVGTVFDVINHVTEKVPAQGTSKGLQGVSSRSMVDQSLIFMGNPELADVSFVAQKIGLSLFKGATSLVGKSGSVNRDAAQAFGGIYLDNLSASGHYWSDGTMDAKLGLDEILMHDDRAEALAPLRNLFVMDTGRGSGAGQLLSVGIRMEEDPNSGSQIYSLTLHSRSFKWILNMDFINAVARFAVSIMDRMPKLEDEEKDKQSAAAAHEEHAHANGPVSAIRIGSIGGAASPSAAPAPAPVPLINADVSMEEITVVVLENPNSTETNAILLTYSGLVKVTTKSGTSKGNASLKLSAFTSRFDLTAPIKRIGEILRPMSIDANLELVPGSKTEVDLTTSDVTVHYSAGTLHLMVKIATEFMDSIKTSHHQGDELEDHSQAWISKEFDATKYWFLEESASSAGPVRSLGLGVVDASPARPVESIRVSTGRIFLTIESGVGAMTTPLLFVDTSVEATVTDWSSQLHVVGALKLTCGYNNAHVGAMEYLIEPTGVSGGGVHAPWELSLDVQKAAESDTDPGKLVVNVSSNKTLELMVSKSSREIVNAVIAAFSTATEAGTVSTKSQSQQQVTASTANEEARLQSAPYVLFNSCGTNLTVNIQNTAFLYYIEGEEAPPGNILVPQGQSVQFGIKSGVGRGNDAAADGSAKHEMVIDIPQYQFRSSVIVSQSQSRYFNTPLMNSMGPSAGVLVDVEITADYSTHVTVRSIVQVINELPVAVEVYSAFPGKMSQAGTVEPGNRISLPFNALTDQSLGLEFRPRGYGSGSEYYSLSNLFRQQNQELVIQETVSPQDVSLGPDSFTFNIVGTAHAAANGNSDQQLASKNVTLRLKPPFSFRNILPLPVVLLTPTKQQIQVPAGRQFPITSVPPSNPNPIGRRQGWGQPTNTNSSGKQYSFPCILVGYQGQNWTTNFTLTDNPSMPSQGNFTFSGPASNTYPYKPMQIYFNFERVLGVGVNKGEMTLSLRCSFWILNYTTLDLAYFNPAGKFALVHPASDERPQLFTSDAEPPAPAQQQQQQQQGPDTGPKTKLCIQVQNGGWSQPVAVDAVSIPVQAICRNKSGGLPYELSINTELASGDHLTKIITITPRYTITNGCSFPVQWMEASQNSGNLKITIPAASTIPFWPPVPVQSSLPLLAVDGTDEWTPVVPIKNTGAGGGQGSSQHFLPFDSGHRYGGLGVSINAQDTKTIIQIHKFQADEIPLLFVNALDGVRFEIWEDPLFESFPLEIQTLESKSRLFHAWKNPLIDPESRVINWRIAAAAAGGSGGGGNGQVFRMDVSRDQTLATQFITPNGQSCICYIFTPGLRHVLLFTTQDSNFPTLERAKKAREAAATMQVNFSLQSVGLSMIDNIASRDVIYCRVSGLAASYVAYPLGFGAQVSIHDIRIDNQDKDATYPVILAATQPQQPQSQFPGLRASQVPQQPQSQFLNLRASQVRATPKSSILFISGSVGLQEFKFSGDMDLVGNILELFILDASKSSNANTSSTTYGAITQSVAEYYAAQTLTAAGASSSDNGDGNVKKTKQESILLLRDVSIDKARSNVSFSMAGIDSLAQRLADNTFVRMILGVVGSIRIGITNVHVEMEGMHWANQRTTLPELLDSIKSHYTQEGYKAIFSNLVGAMFAGAGSLVGHTVGGVVSTAGGLFSEVGHITDSLHIPLLGGLFGGVSHALDDTAKGINKVADGGGSEARMRLPRDLKIGIPIQPYAIVYGGGNGGGRLPPTSINFPGRQQQSSGTPLGDALQRTSFYAGAGAYISEVYFGSAGVVLTQNKIFHVEMGAVGKITKITPFNWTAVKNIRTDGGSAVVLEIVAADPFRLTLYTNKTTRFPINTGSSDMCQYLLGELYRVQATLRR